MFMPWRYPTGGAATGGSYISALVAGLQADGVFSLLDRLWVFAQPTSALALVDLVAGAVATPQNGPIFTANRSYAGDGFSAYVDLGFNPATAGGHYSKDSACLFAYDRTNRTSAANKTAIGCNDGTQAAFLIPMASGSITAVRMNDNNSGSAAATNAQGFWHANRAGSAARAIYLNGALFSSQSPTSVGLPNDTLTALAQSGGTNFSDDQLAAVGIGGSLNATQAAALYNRIQTYMTAIGAAV
jgi:hypothetical protein